ncbi:hypothetical protein Acr_05g0001930 [Actinidia rufa]|uniref:Uncharacterized protein n=1 Tax=Actinidia rufa TaxID=165716 RepID=A0A7J0EJB8_9ERIC|nr:hypothetical protein Acr_05g0001930 [Actinidia rufa]
MKWEYRYLIEDPQDGTDSTFGDWDVEDAQFAFVWLIVYLLRCPLLMKLVPRFLKLRSSPLSVRFLAGFVKGPSRSSIPCLATSVEHCRLPKSGPGCAGRSGNDYPSDVRVPGLGDRESRGDNQSRGCGPQRCTHYNLIVHRCWDLHGRPVAHHGLLL